MTRDDEVYEGETQFGQYKVVDTTYGGRPARVLYSGNHLAAQSGIAYDDNPELLFDYNRRFFELVDGLQPASCLVIGGGAFTLPKALIEEYPDVRLCVVELDKGLIEVATKYFDFVPGQHTEIVVSEGRGFLESSDATYDMIIIDAFTHSTIPVSLQTVEAARAIAKRLNPNGVVAMNIIAAFYGTRSAVLKRQIAAFRAAFQYVQIFPAGKGLSLWTPQNFILTAQNHKQDLAQYIRYAALELPATDSGDALHDPQT